MNASIKTITILASVFLMSCSSLAQARERRSRARQAPARNERGRGGKDSRHGLTLSIDLGRIFNNTTTSRRWVRGYYQTGTEQVLVEPGHYEWRRERVLVEPGHYEIRRQPVVEEIIRGSRGKARRVVVKRAGRKKVWIPARYEMRRVRVYVAPRYETRRVRVWVPGHWVSQPVRSPARSR